MTKNQIKSNKVRLLFMDKKAVFALVTCLFVFSFAKIKPIEKEKINWISIEEANLKMKTDPRPVMIDLYTNWCYWCKMMDKKTYNNSKVISYINDHFYAVKLNAETKDTLLWNNKDYGFNTRDKVNDFALYLTQGQLSFPSTIIFPEINTLPAAIPGFMEPKEIEVILTYFGDHKYKSQNFSEYSANFKSTW